jgi:hypothetical protein
MERAWLASSPESPLSGAEIRALIDLSIPEAAWQETICAYADTQGWRWWHDKDSRGNEASFPDLPLWRDRLIFFENKTMKGKLSVDGIVRDRRTGRYYPKRGQAETIIELLDAGQEVYIPRPCDWGRVIAVLQRGGVPDEEWLRQTRTEAEAAIAKKSRRASA